jgi:hypothetical protein
MRSPQAGRQPARGARTSDPIHASREREADSAAQRASGGLAVSVLTRLSAPALQRKCACGGTCPECREEERLRLQQMPATSSPPGPASSGTSGPFGIVVDDDAETAVGQVRRSAFLTELESRLVPVCNEELEGTGQSADRCPYIVQWLAFYRGRSAAHIERTIRHYAREQATDAAGLIDVVAARAREAVRQWRVTGRVPPLPGGAPDTGLPPAGEGALQMKREDEDGSRSLTTASPTQIRSQLDEGASLESGSRTRMESAFGVDFSDVRIHTGARAAALSRRLHARAFTIGRDIAFASGEYRPGSPAGDVLIAHELAHVVQQRGGMVPQQVEDRPAAYRSLEADADASAAAASTSVWGSQLGIEGAMPAKPTLRSGLRLQRCDDSAPSAPSAAAPAASPPAVPTPPAVPLSELKVVGRVEDPGDIKSIYFDRGSSTIPAAEAPKIPAIIAAHSTDPLTLNAYRSEDEPVTLAEERAKKVDTALGSASPPHTGPAAGSARTRVPLPAHGVGRIEYRDLRKVEVEVTPSGHAVAPPRQPSCAAGPSAPCGTAFSTAKPRARAWLRRAIAQLSRSPRPAAVTSLLTRLFGGPAAGPAAAPTIVANLRLLDAHIQDMSLPGRLRCHNECDGGCVNPAYNTGTGAGSVMTLCPRFLNNPNLDSRAATLIHEGAHGTAGLATVDLAYGHTRLIEALSPADSLRNTDSYVLLVRLINVPGSANIGVAGDVRAGGMTADEDRAASTSLAHLEKWLTQAYQDVASAYDAVNAAVAGGAWTGTTVAYDRRTVRTLAPLFGLTDPGATAPFTLPTEADKLRLAGIYDRFLAMRSVMWGRGITMTKIAAGADSWAPGPGATVELTPAFFALGSVVDRIRRLVELIAAAHPGVSAALRPQYVDAVDGIRRNRRLGP